MRKLTNRIVKGKDPDAVLSFYVNIAELPISSVLGGFLLFK